MTTYQVFVGNVPYGTTEERLRSVFSTVGRVVNVRVMSDRSDPKKGYAFVEYDNPDTALSAIRNLAQTELDGRRLRVGFSNNSNLEDIAKQRGISIPASASAPQSSQHQQQQQQQPAKTVESVLAYLSLHEMYDIISHLKELAETKPDELRLLLISHPQIAEAIVHMQVKIGMIKPLTRSQPDAQASASLPPPPSHAPAPASSAYMPPTPQPPLGFPPPRGLPPLPPQGLPPPPTQPPPQAWSAAAIPTLPGLPPGVSQQEIVQQLMQLSPEQLQQIDPTQRQIIMQLRSALGL